MYQGRTRQTTIAILNVHDIVWESKLRLRIQAELAPSEEPTLVVERHIACGAHNAADGIDPLWRQAVRAAQSSASTAGRCGAARLESSQSTA